MRVFFVVTFLLVILYFRNKNPCSPTQEHVVGQAAELAQCCIFLVFVQSCTKCVRMYFLLDSNSGLFDSDLVVQVAI